MHVRNPTAVAATLLAVAGGGTLAVAALPRLYSVQLAAFAAIAYAITCWVLLLQARDDAGTLRAPMRFRAPALALLGLALLPLLWRAGTSVGDRIFRGQMTRIADALGAGGIAADLRAPDPAVLPLLARLGVRQARVASATNGTDSIVELEFHRGHAAGYAYELYWSSAGPIPTTTVTMGGVTQEIPRTDVIIGRCEAPDLPPRWCHLPASSRPALAWWTGEE